MEKSVLENVSSYTLNAARCLNIQAEYITQSLYLVLLTSLSIISSFLDTLSTQPEVFITIFLYFALSFADAIYHSYKSAAKDLKYQLTCRAIPTWKGLTRILPQRYGYHSKYTGFTLLKNSMVLQPIVADTLNTLRLFKQTLIQLASKVDTSITSLVISRLHRYRHNCTKSGLELTNTEDKERRDCILGNVVVDTHKSNIQSTYAIPFDSNAVQLKEEEPTYSKFCYNKIMPDLAQPLKDLRNQSSTKCNPQKGKYTSFLSNVETQMDQKHEVHDSREKTVDFKQSDSNKAESNLRNIFTDEENKQIYKFLTKRNVSAALLCDREMLNVSDVDVPLTFSGYERNPITLGKTAEKQEKKQENIRVGFTGTSDHKGNKMVDENRVNNTKKCLVKDTTKYTFSHTKRQTPPMYPVNEVGYQPNRRYLETLTAIINNLKVQTKSKSLENLTEIQEPYNPKQQLNLWHEAKDMDMKDFIEGVGKQTQHDEVANKIQKLTEPEHSFNLSSLCNVDIDIGVKTTLKHVVNCTEECSGDRSEDKLNLNDSGGHAKKQTVYERLVHDIQKQADRVKDTRKQSYSKYRIGNNRTQSNFKQLYDVVGKQDSLQKANCPKVVQPTMLFNRVLQRSKVPLGIELFFWSIIKSERLKSLVVPV